MTALLLLMSLLSGPILVQPSGVSELAHVDAAPQAASKLSYDAAEPKGRRKAPRIDHRSEDLILDGSKRAKVQANADDIARNFATARWMIRKHLDFVTSFEFLADTGNDEFDEALEEFVRRWSRAPNFDRAGRHPLWRMIRLAEAQRTIRGDCGILKLADGRVQAIESDRIRNWGGATTAGTDQQWIHGVKTDTAGRAIAYAIHRRRQGSFEFERTVPAGNLILHGYFDRFDQVRGISPIVSALDPLRDLYEAQTLALAKMKVEQLFALAFFRDATESAGNVEELAETTDTGATRTSYQVDFGGGPVLLDLDPGDKAEFLQGESPSANFQAFSQIVLATAMRSLDLPYIMADEGAGVFHSFRGSWLIYNRSCESKQAEVRDVLMRLTMWRIVLAIIDGELVLPRGLAIEDIDFAWNHRGFPWFDPNKELTGDNAAIAAGYDTPQRVTLKRGGGDWYKNILDRKHAEQFARDNGVAVSFGPPAPQPIEVVEKEEEGRRAK
jgi:capsid protein